MEYFTTINTIGVRSNNIQVEINKEKTNIIININKSNLIINREFIIKISPNFSVELFYYILCGFLKYNNYKLIEVDNHYIFDGYYNEPYEQGEEIHINFTI